MPLRFLDSHSSTHFGIEKYVFACHKISLFSWKTSTTIFLMISTQLNAYLFGATEYVQLFDQDIFI